MRTTSFLQRPSQHGLGSKIHSVLANIAPEKHLTWLKKKNSDKPSSLIVISTQLYQPTNKPKSPAERSTQNWPTSCLINIIMDIRSPLKIPNRMFRKHLFNKFLTTMSSSMVIFQRLKEWWPTQNTSFKVISICETKCWVDDKYMYSKITSPAISSSWLHNFHAGLTKSCLLKWFCAQCVCVIFINSLSLLFHVKYNDVSCKILESCSFLRPEAFSEFNANNLLWPQGIDVLLKASQKLFCRVWNICFRAGKFRPHVFACF